MGKCSTLILVMTAALIAVSFVAPVTASVDVSNPYYSIWFGTGTYEEKTQEFYNAIGQESASVLYGVPLTSDTSGISDMKTAYQQFNAGNIEIEDLTESQKLSFNNFLNTGEFGRTQEQRLWLRGYEDCIRDYLVPESDIQHDISYGLVSAGSATPDTRIYSYTLHTSLMPQEMRL